MAQPDRASSQDSVSDGIRKRVCKACDRCRLKKSKCDGSHPCLRCKADNAICVFGERKKSHDKVYPKGYVEMLEQQQAQLVAGLQDMYARLRDAQAWTGPPLAEHNGHPLTHDVLSALDLLDTKHDGSGDVESFEEDVEKLQSHLLANGANYAHRRNSFSSDSDHSHDEPYPHSASSKTSRTGKRPAFREGFDFKASTTLLVQSPVPRQLQSYSPTQPSPLQQSLPLSNDPQFYQADWTIPGLANQDSFMRSEFALQTPALRRGMSEMDSVLSDTVDLQNANSFSGFDENPYYARQMGGVYGSFMPAPMDYGLEPMELDFTKYVQVAT